VKFEIKDSKIKNVKIGFGFWVLVDIITLFLVLFYSAGGLGINFCFWANLAGLLIHPVRLGFIGGE
jgi:hypothetical protein